jgi:hypothetical protein
MRYAVQCFFFFFLSIPIQLNLITHFGTCRDDFYRLSAPLFSLGPRISPRSWKGRDIKPSDECHLEVSEP